MKKSVISILIVLLAFTSCNLADKLNNPADVENEVDLKEISYQITNDVKAKNDYYYEYEVKIPQLKIQPEKLTKATQETFNNAIKEFVTPFLEEYKPGTLVEKKNIVDVILVEDSISAKENSMVYSLNIEPIINENSEKGIISVKFIIDKFDLGIHPNTYFKTFNFDMKTGKFIAMDDILDVRTEGNLDKLNALVLKYFDNSLGCFDLKPKATTKNVQFSLTEENVVFSYQPYVLGAYTCGSSTILVPISELKKAGIWK